MRKFNVGDIVEFVKGTGFSSKRHQRNGNLVPGKLYRVIAYRNYNEFSNQSVKQLQEIKLDNFPTKASFYSTAFKLVGRQYDWGSILICY